MLKIKKYAKTVLLIILFGINNIIIFTTPKENIPPAENIFSTTTTYTYNNSANIEINDWLFMVYMTSNNSLDSFTTNNIDQMKKIGSNKNVSIVVQKDTYGEQKISRLFIKKDEIETIEILENKPECISGTTESLYKFVEWGTKKYKFNKLALIIWDHGSGIEDPDIFGRKGIAFNDIFETYLTNQDLTNALKKISTTLLDNKKIDILGMDACNMAMTEICSQIKDYANFFVGSQEVEPGTGWDYKEALEQLLTTTLSSEQLSNQIVLSYKNFYEKTLADFTQSAINLNKHEQLEENINQISMCLLKLLKSNIKKATIKQLKKIRSSYQYTTVFANKNYIDLYHFYSSLLDKIDTLEYSDSDATKTLNHLEHLLISGLKIISENISAYATSQNLPKAHGISIYYPERKIHASYKKTIFAQKNNWENFLEEYIKETRPILYNKNTEKCRI